MTAVVTFFILKIKLEQHRVRGGSLWAEHGAEPETFAQAALSWRAKRLNAAGGIAPRPGAETFQIQVLWCYSVIFWIRQNSTVAAWMRRRRSCSRNARRRDAI